MAGRPKGIWTPEIVRKRIQATKLVMRLQQHAMGEIEMTATQIRAAEVILKKKLPDLMTTELTGELRHRDISDQPLTAEEWERQYADHLEAPEGSAEKFN